MVVSRYCVRDNKEERWLDRCVVMGKYYLMKTQPIKDGECWLFIVYFVLFLSIINWLLLQGRKHH